MKRNASTGIALVALMSLSAAFSTGCSSGGSQAKESSKAVESIHSLSAQLDMAPKQVDAVNAAIDKLQAGGDLAGAYKQYTSAVADIEAGGNKAKARRETMLKNREEYIAKWQKELESIQNPDVKAALTERKQKVASSFDGIKSSAQGLRDAYIPYLQTLKEIQQGLAIDLNASGVAAMKKPLDAAKTDGDTLKTKAATLAGQLRDIAGSMSPTSPTAPATPAPAAPATPAPAAAAPAAAAPATPDATATPPAAPATPDTTATPPAAK